MVDVKERISLIEAMLFVSGDPLTLEAIKGILDIQRLILSRL